MNDLSTVASLFNPYTLLLLALGVGVLWTLNWLLRRANTRLTERFPSQRFRVLQVTTLASFAVWIIGSSALVVGILQPPREVMLGIAGSMAVAFGFALKDIVGSLAAGVILLFDRPFRVGDRVTYGDTYGEITSIGLRAVRLQTLDDNTVTIPNNAFISGAVASANAGALDMQVTCDFHIALDADLDLAMRLVEEVAYTSRFAYLKKPVLVLVDEVNISERLALRVRVRVYVFDTRYEKALTTDITTRVARLFRKHGITRPARDVVGQSAQETQPAD